MRDHMWSELFVDAPIGDSRDSVESDWMICEDLFGSGSR